MNGYAHKKPRKSAVFCVAPLCRKRAGSILDSRTKKSNMSREGKHMKKKFVILTAAIAAAAMAAPVAVSAMPGDLKEIYEKEYEDGAYYNQYPDAFYENYVNDYYEKHAQDYQENQDYYDNKRDYYVDDYYDQVDYASGENFEAINENYVCTGSANVRNYPNGDIISTTVSGDTYFVEGACTDCHWYKVIGFGQDAYVYADYLVPKSEYKTGSKSNSEDGYDFQKIDVYMTATTDVNMRKTPGGAIVGGLKKGEEIHVTGNVSNRTWYRCDYKGDTVYVSDDYLTPELPQTMICTADCVNVREANATGAKVIGTLRKGDKVKVTAFEDGWYKFTSEKIGKAGYSYDEFFAVIE